MNIPVLHIEEISEFPQVDVFIDRDCRLWLVMFIKFKSHDGCAVEVSPERMLEFLDGKFELKELFENAAKYAVTYNGKFYSIIDYKDWVLDWVRVKKFEKFDKEFELNHYVTVDVICNMMLNDIESFRKETVKQCDEKLK